MLIYHRKNYEGNLKFVLVIFNYLKNNSQFYCRFKCRIGHYFQNNISKSGLEIPFSGILIFFID